MVDHLDDEMPAEFDYSSADRPVRPALGGAPVTITITQADGHVETRTETLGVRPDIDAVGPNSVSGSIGDLAYFVYNPDNDVVSFRLESSFGERVSLDDPDPSGIRAFRSVSSGKVVGMVIANYIERFAGIKPGPAQSIETLRSGIGVLGHILQAA